MFVVSQNLLNSRFMNILIENAESLEYLTEDGQWTKNAAEGKRFAATGTAFQTAKKEPVGKFNIVCYIAQSKQLINLNHGKGKGADQSAT